MNIAIVLAGGTGSRMNQSTPKQFIDVNGKPLIIYTLEKIQQSELIDEIAIVCLDGWQEYIKENISKYNINKAKYIVKGGTTRVESIINGYDSIKDICDDNTNILIHDGNRPNVSQELLRKSIELCNQKGNAISYVPCLEVIYYSEDLITSNKQIDKDKLARTQTPHTFKKHLLDKLVNYVKDNNLYNEPAIHTICEKIGETIYLCKGDESNFKVTYQSDIDRLKVLLEHKLLTK